MLHMFYLFLCSRQNVHNWMIFAWACRLGTFLFMRVLKEGQDKRFDKARDSPATFLVFWSLQGVWVWVTLLPSLILNTERRDPALGARDYLGWGLWVAGFLIEVVADMQKSIFRANPENDVSSNIIALICNMKGIYPAAIFVTGKIYLLRTMVTVPPPKLFWRNPALVWDLHLQLQRVPRVAVPQRAQPGLHLPAHNQGVR